MRGFHRGAGQFFVLEKLENPVSIDSQALTDHYEKERVKRINVVRTSGSEPCYSFIVDTGHPNGDEIHTITDKADIIIQNKESKRIVTVLFARPAQVTRYWKNMNIGLPNDETFKLIQKFAKSNLDRNLNNL